VARSPDPSGVELKILRRVVGGVPPGPNSGDVVDGDSGGIGSVEDKAEVVDIARLRLPVTCT